MLRAFKQLFPAHTKAAPAVRRPSPASPFLLTRPNIEVSQMLCHYVQMQPNCSQ